MKKCTIVPTSNYYTKNPDKNKKFIVREDGQEFEVTSAQILHVINGNGKNKVYNRLQKCSKGRYGFNYVAVLNDGEYDPRDSDTVTGFRLFFEFMPNVKK
jgi:hypothetical protein